MSGSELFTRNFLINTGICFFYTINFFLLFICMSDYASSKFGVSAWESGFAASIFVFGGLAARIFFGRFMDMIGRKKFLIIGLSVGTIISLGYFFASSMPSLYLVRFIHGMSYGICTMAVTTMIADMVPSERRGEGIGYFMLSVTIATAIGPFLSMVLLNNGGYEMIFIISILMYVLSLAATFFINVPRIILTDEQRESLRGFKFSSFMERSVIRISMVCMIFYFAYSGVLTFVAQYGSSIGLNVGTMYFFVVMAIATCISRLFIGRIYDRRGENVVMIPCFILFVIGMIVFSQATTDSLFLFSGFMIGFGVAVIYSIGQSIVIKIAPRHRYGMATSTFSSFVEMAYGMGPLIIGFIVASFGYRDMFLMMAGVGFISLMLYMVMHGFKVMKKPLDES